MNRFHSYAKHLIQPHTTGGTVSLTEQSLNHIDNSYSFGSQFESEFSKSVNAKQKSKSLFTGLEKVNCNYGAGASRSPNHILP